MPRIRVIDVANEQVTIVAALRMAGVLLPEDIGAGRSRKVHCPFGALYHSDAGAAAALRVYPETNSAYCFNCSQSYTPVTLTAAAMNCSRGRAAAILLDRIGYRPPHWATNWERTRRYEPELDKTSMADALKTYCRRVDRQWADRQFEPAVAAALSRCLSLLELVRTASEVPLWLAGCKQVMDRALDMPSP